MYCTVLGLLWTIKSQDVYIYRKPLRETKEKLCILGQMPKLSSIYLSILLSLSVCLSRVLAAKPWCNPMITMDEHCLSLQQAVNPFRCIPRNCLFIALSSESAVQLEGCQECFFCLFVLTWVFIILLNISWSIWSLIFCQWSLFCRTYSVSFGIFVLV